VHRAHEFAFRGKRNFPHSVQPLAELPGFQSRFARGNHQGALGRVALNLPLALVFLQHRIVRPIGDGQRAL
jgi:hypothetical protein